MILSSAYEDNEDIVNILSSVWVMLPYLPSYIAIIFLFSKIRNALNGATAMMSSRTKKAHLEIIKVSPMMEKVVN